MNCVFCDASIEAAAVQCASCRAFLKLECPSCHAMTSVFGDRCAHCAHPRKSPPAVASGLLESTQTGPDKPRMSMMSLFMRADATVMLGAALFSLFTLDPVFTLVWSASGVTSLVLARHMERSDFEARQARVAWSRQ